MSDRLDSITVTAPGFLGLNLQESTIREEPGWALVADNCVFDDAGRIAARKGYTRVNSSDTLGTDILKMAEYKVSASSSEMISTTASNIYKGTGANLTSLTGSLTPSDGLWKFVTFIDVTTYSGAAVCIGVQTGETPIIYTNSGSFANVASVETTEGAGDGMPINGNEILAAFGRLWVVAADGVTIAWCPLRDCNDGAATNSFEKTGAGSINVSSVWPQGNDYIKALAAFDDKLIIFGEHNILVYNNPWTPDDSSTPLTLDTTNQLGGTIGGIGCIARDSVQHIGDDLFFLSHHGIRSLRRTLITETIPEQDISKYNRDDLMSYVDSITNKNKIDSVYNQEDGFYLISLPLSSGATLNTTLYYIDTKRELPDGARRMTKWVTMPINTLVYDSSLDNMYWGDGSGFVDKYTGYQDNGASYSMEYVSTWQDFKSPNLKFPKKIKMIVNGGSNYTINFKWAFDFKDSFFTQNTNIAGSDQDPDEYNVATTEWGGQTYSYFDQWAASTAHVLYDIVVPSADNGYFYWCSTAGTTGGSEPTWDTSSPSGTTADGTVTWTTSAMPSVTTEWSGADNLSSTVQAHLSKNGQHIRYGWNVPVNGDAFSVHRIDIFAKIGRLNR